MLVLLALLAASPPAHTEAAAASGAQPPAETWTFQRADHLTRSSTLGFSTDWRSRGQVVLQRAPDGSVTLEENGESTDRTWDQAYGRSVDTTTWRTTWRGTWRTDGAQDRAVLTLQRTGRSCEVTRARDRVPTAREPCPDGAEEQRLLCHLTELQLGQDSTAPDGPRQPLGAWECVPAEVTLPRPDTPLPWIFGQGACVEASRENPTDQRLRLCDADDSD